MKKLTRYAKTNRERPTKAEALMKKCLQRAGLKFRSQRPFGPYIVDFVLPLKRVVIEVDGGYHETSKQIEKDAKRTAYLERCGLTVKRICNASILANDVHGFFEEIQAMPDIPIGDWKEAYGFPIF